MEKAKKKILEFAKDRDWDQFHTPENIAKSISIEAGELLECFQWNAEFNRDEVIDELADIVNYCVLLSTKLNVDLETIVLEKIQKNELKYPLDKSKGTSKKYNKL
jgi:dCTP diphosphatase